MNVWLLTTMMIGSNPASAGILKPVAVTASSEYEADGHYAARRVADGKASTSWVEGDEGSGLGAWLEFDLGEGHDVSRVRVWGGDWFSDENWRRANRPKELQIKFSDGSVETMKLDDEMKMQELVFPSPKSSTSVRFVLKGSYPGTTWLDTAVSEIQVFDNSQTGHVEVLEVVGSTTHAPDADGTYEPSNVSDGIIDSMWCDGSKDGDGTGEWLDFKFSSPTSVSSIDLINGIATSMKYWMMGNRATAATLTFSDGSTEAVEVKNTMRMQTIPFPAHTTSSVRVTFTTVAQGKEYNDLCIAEAYLK